MLYLKIKLSSSCGEILNVACKNISSSCGEIPNVVCKNKNKALELLWGDTECSMLYAKKNTYTSLIQYK